MTIRGVESPSDIAAVSALIQTAFDLRPGLGEAYARTYRALWERASAMAPPCSRAANRDGEVCGHALVIPRSIGVCGVPTPAGIIAYVAVRGDCRGKGLGTALVEDAIDYLRKRGALVSHLSGAPSFYRRFGFVESCIRCRGWMKCEDLRPYDGRTAVREAGPLDAAALRELYDVEYRQRTGCILRDAAQWTWQLGSGHPLGYAASNSEIVGFLAEAGFCLLAGTREQPAGYLRLLAGPGRAIAHEGAARTADAPHALFDRARRIAIEYGANCIELALPSDGALARWALGHQACIHETLDPEVLIKVLDLPGLLGRLAPVFARRVSESPLRAASTHLLLETEKDRVDLRVSPEGVSFSEARTHEAPDGPGDPAVSSVEWRVTLPEIALTQMLFGARDYATVFQTRPGAEAGLIDWISVLFPVQKPHICLGDTL